jgi:hypothetical protein
MFVGVAVLLLVSVGSGCIIETSDCWRRPDGTCAVVGASCDWAGDQDCFNRTQAWFCTGGTIVLNDCIQQCAGLAPYACCGYDPTYGDDNCLCCMAADCSGLACHI